MTVKLSPLYVDAQLINGIPANGAKLFTYAAGSSTKQNTYTDSTGTVAQANPIILNSRGEPANPIWLTVGQSYKFVFTASTDSDPPASPIRTIDNVTGVNDSSVTLDQWVVSGVTPTYVSATQFTVPGDQTSIFTVNRRIKATVTAGTVYGYITVSAYTALTTVTVVLDSGALDSGLSAVQLGLLTPTQDSLPQNFKPPFVDSTAIIKGSADATKLLAFEVDTNQTTATTRTITTQNVSGTMGLAENQIQPITASVGSNALTITLNPTSLAFRSATIGSGTVNVRAVNAAISVVVSSGSTLGTTSAIQSRLAVLAIDNAGTVELAVVNLSGGNDLTETGVISTTAEGGAGAADSANVIYSTTARSNVAYRVVGYVESTQATAGTWATAPSTIQGFGGNVKIQGVSTVQLNTANGYGSSSTQIRRFTNVIRNQGADITYADSATLGGTFTINTSGVYAISYNDQFSTAAAIGVSVNSNQLTTSIQAITVSNVLTVATAANANQPEAVATTVYLTAGDVVRAHNNGVSSGSTTNSCQFAITKVI